MLKSERGQNKEALIVFDDSKTWMMRLFSAVEVFSVIEDTVSVLISFMENKVYNPFCSFKGDVSFSERVEEFQSIEFGVVISIMSIKVEFIQYRRSITPSTQSELIVFIGSNVFLDMEFFPGFLDCYGTDTNQNRTKHQK